MEYPRKLIDYIEILNNLSEYKVEMGSNGVDDIMKDTDEFLANTVKKLQNLKVSISLNDEPDTIEQIMLEWPKQQESTSLSNDEYLKKLEGAIVGRFAGCALGAPLEFATTEQMRMLSEKLGTDFPPTNYWKEAPQAYIPRYSVGFAKEFTLGHIEFLSPDDDIIYTIMSLLVMEKHGRDFTTQNMAELWIDRIPLECTYTAERAVLENLQKGEKLPEATINNNAYLNWIGGYIRCDGYGYVNPLRPDKAAMLAFKDGALTHRNSGLYSTMYFAAVIALAFRDVPLKQSFYDALQYVPKKSAFYKTINNALNAFDTIKNHEDAVKYVKDNFKGMSDVHSENNACLTVFGALLGENNYEKGISETVAMGYDNDCTAATVGSILGAHLGIDAIDKKWYGNWNDTVKTYIKDLPTMQISDIVKRFSQLRED